MSPTNPPAKKVRDPRNGLRTSATLATIFTILGHTVFGFEQAVAHVFTALIAGYISALLFETLDAKMMGRTPGYAGGGALKVVDWLLSAHMTSITMAFLMYTADHYLVLAAGVVVAIGSKYVLRVKQGPHFRHFMNPSNFGIAVLLLVFPWTGTLPWGITVNTHGWSDWAIPIFVTMLGFRLNLLFTRRLPLIAAWLVAFALQGFIRAEIWDLPFAAQVSPLTGIAMVLFSFYMITDPQTSPSALRSQILFGASIGQLYGLMFALGLNYTLFFAVTAVCGVRGAWMALENRGLVPSFAPVRAIAQPTPGK